jgi:hypothetical protein
MLQKISRTGLWVSTIVILALLAAQGISGNWSAFYLAWPGSNLSEMLIQITARLAAYHVKMGIAIGVITVVIIIFAFLAKSSLYVRVFAILGLVVTASAIMGAFLFVGSGLMDRLSLGQMADSFVGAFAAYFLLLLFASRLPKLPGRPGT